MFDTWREDVIAAFERNPGVTQMLGFSLSSAGALASYCKTLMPILQLASVVVSITSGLMLIALQVRQWRRERQSK